MSDTGNVAKSLRERLGGNTEDRVGKAFSELLENPLLTGAIGRAFDAREKAAQAQEVAMGALNLPSAADIERLTRRLRAVSHRLEGIEDGVDRLDRALAPSGVEARLSAIEGQLAQLTEKLDRALGNADAPAPAGRAARARAGARTTETDKQVGAARAARRAKDGGAAKPKAPRASKAARSARAAGSPGARSRANRPPAGKA
ncbi:MAG TPA: hypothetical protein VNV44_01310 [Solirubrobacteraceae bacterium]|nr:hypothetical protein [Solirubrobacteraceae bacterium]